MDRRNNPYAPGAGLQPPELAGRDRLIDDVTIDMDRILRRRPTKGLILLGLRGVETGRVRDPPSAFLGTPGSAFEWTPGRH